MNIYQNLLDQLIRLEQPERLQDILDALEQHAAAGHQVEFDIDDIIAILERYLQNELTADDVAAWANALASREDIDFAVAEDDGVLLDILDELANPLIEGELTPEKAKDLIEEMS